MLIHKAYRLKLYPNVTQEKRLLENADAVRFVWNYFLALKRDVYFMGGKSPSYHSCSAALTDLKRQDGMEWLHNRLAQPMQQTLRDLEGAYRSFFQKSARFPRFKSKKDAYRSFRIHTTWKLRGGKLQLERDIIVRTRDALPPMKAKCTSVTISHNACKT